MLKATATKLAGRVIKAPKETRLFLWFFFFLRDRKFTLILRKESFSCTSRADIGGNWIHDVTESKSTVIHHGIRSFIAIFWSLCFSFCWHFGIWAKPSGITRASSLRLRGRDKSAATVDPKGPSDPLSPSQYAQTHGRMVTRTSWSLNCAVNRLNAGSNLLIQGKGREGDTQKEECPGKEHNQEKELVLSIFS